MATSEASGTEAAAQAACGASPTGLQRRWPLRRREAGELPSIVLLAYFLIAWLESFPLLAYKELMVDELHMALPLITTFYAVTFLPFMWKPVYGWLSDSLPIFGRRRTPYIFASSLGTGVFQMATARYAHTVEGLFGLYFALQACLAMLQFMVGSFLVDLAAKEGGSPVVLQGAANAAKWAGSLAAQLSALLVYGGGTETAFGARTAVAGGALAPLLLAVLAPLLPEERESSLGCVQRCASPPWRKPETAGLTVTVAIAQANFVLIGCQQLMSFDTWWRAVALCVPASTAIVVVLHCASIRRAAAAPDGSGAVGRRSSLSRLLRWPRLCLVCFLVPTMPSSSVAVDQLQFVALRKGSYQALGIVAAAASVAASCAFSGSFRSRGLRFAFVASALLAALLSMAALPFALTASHGAHDQDLLSPAGMWGVASSVVGAFGSLWTVLPMDALMTAASASAGSRSSIAYGVLLSCYDFGGTASGLIAAPVLRATGLGAGNENWDSLPYWVVGTALLRLLVVLALLPLISSELEARPPERDSEQQEVPARDPADSLEMQRARGLMASC